MAGRSARSFGGHEAIQVAATEREGELSSAGKMPGVVNLSCQVERKAKELPRFLVVPAHLLKEWTLAGTTVVEARINDIPVGRRSLKKWDDDRWFVELAQSMCERAGVDTGDRVSLAIQLVSDELPDELARLLADSRRARAAWAKLTPAKQRTLREEIFTAKAGDTRRRRAERALGISRTES